MDTRRTRRGYRQAAASAAVEPVISFQPGEQLPGTEPQENRVLHTEIPSTAISAQMPGSFALQTQPIVSQSQAAGPEDPSVAERAFSERRSPNPFLSRVPFVGTARPLPATSPFPQQLQGNSHLVTTRIAPVPFTPRVSVPVRDRNEVAPYNSPEISGPANFGPSVSQQDLWDEPNWSPANVPIIQQSTHIPDNGGENILQGLERISEGEELEYTDTPRPTIPATSTTAASDSPRRLAEPLTAGISRARDGMPDYGAAVRDLVGVGGAVRDVANPENPERYYYTFPACILHHEFQGTTEAYEGIQRRIHQANSLAQEFLQRVILHNDGNHIFSRGGRIYFRNALQMMAALFSNLFRANNGRIHCFKVDRLIYIDLNNELLRLRRENEEGFVATGFPVTRLPKWGLDGNLDEYWSANDFEVMAAAYRTEVEHFLQTISVARLMLGNTPAPSIAATSVARSVPIDVQGERASGSVRSSSHRADNRNPFSTIPQQMVQAPQIGHSAPATVEATNPNIGPTAVTFAAPAQRNSRRPSNLNSTAFGLSAQTTSSNRLQAMFGRPNTRIGVQTRGGDGPPSDDSSDESDNDARVPRSSSGRPPRRRNDQREGQRQPTVPPQPQFDTKLKVDLIPTWDGDVDTLARWIFKVNRISERSTIIKQQLGVLVPTRLTGQAEQWYYSQSPEIRETIETNWITLRQAIGEYYMNEGYIKGLKSRANRARYRQRDHERETPSQYFIRKLELLQLSYNYNDIELIHEIMAGVPESWMSVLSPKTHESVEDFRVTFKYYEDHLTRLEPQNRQWNNNNPYRSPTNDSRTRNPFKPENKIVRTNAVGWSKTLPPPPFPKDDVNVSPRSTPEQKGGRACRHCGSMKHWDPECKYARKGERNARANHVGVEAEDHNAQEEYDDLYYGLSSEDETEDFQDPL